jgi:hypothetical protein
VCPTAALFSAPPLHKELELFETSSVSYDGDEDDVDDGPENSIVDDSFVEEMKKFESNDDRVLAYLSPDFILPRRLRRLVARATRQYHATATAASINGRRYHRAETDDDNDDESSLTMDLAEWMESEYKTRKVPLQVKITSTTDNAAAVRTMTISCESDAERLMVEILSLGAIYCLPYEIVHAFLRGILPLYGNGRGIGGEANDDGDEEKLGDSSRQTIRHMLQDVTGWNDIRFPKGLAIKKKRRKNSMDDAAPTKWYQRLIGRGGWPSAEQAAVSTAAASRQAAPPWVNRTELLLKSIRRQQQQQEVQEDSRLFLPSNSTTTTSMAVPSTNNNNKEAFSFRITTPPLPPRLGFKLYFPTASRRRQFFDHVRDQWQSLYTKAKAQGRASFLGYCVFNLIFYTVGLWWHWHRTTAPSVVTTITATTGGGGAAAAMARSILVRRYGKIFGWLYATSQLCKLPKLLFAVGVAPIIRKRVLDHWSRRYGWSDRKATVVAVMLLLGLFAALTAVPIWHEYRQLLCHISTTTAAAAVGSTREVVQPV